MEGFEEQMNSDEVVYAQDFERKIETPDYVNTCRKQMQGQIAARYYGFDDGAKFIEWIGKDAPKFAEIIEKHPEYLDEYMHGDSEDALNKVSDLLYKKIGVEK